MIGPKPRGTWITNAARNARGYDMLEPGLRYAVIREFEDFDGGVHSYGETWIFLGHSFAPHDDGLSLFVSLDGEHEWHIRMQCRPEAQGRVVDRLAEYVYAVNA